MLLDQYEGRIWVVHKSSQFCGIFLQPLGLHSGYAYCEVPVFDVPVAGQS